MANDHPEEYPAARGNTVLTVSVDGPISDATRKDMASGAASGAPAVRAKTADGPVSSSLRNARTEKPEAKPKVPSAEKVRRQGLLPTLEDDADIGVEKEHIVTRDGKADLMFAGVLLASAASASAPKGTWNEYRIYHTHTGKHVFSKVMRSIFVEDSDAHTAEVFDPEPSTVQAQLVRGAKELARARPLTWKDAAVSFFGYDPLAKQLYRKLDVRFEEQI